MKSVLAIAAIAALTTCSSPRKERAEDHSCRAFADASTLFGLGHDAGERFTDAKHYQRARVLLDAYPGGCNDATYFHIASRLLRTTPSEGLAERIIAQGRHDSDAYPFDRVLRAGHAALWRMACARGLVRGQKRYDVVGCGELTEVVR